MENYSSSQPFDEFQLIWMAKLGAKRPEMSKVTGGVFFHKIDNKFHQTQRDMRTRKEKSRPRHDPTFSRLDVINSKWIYGENRQRARAQHIRRNDSSSRRNFMNKFQAEKLAGEIQSQMNQFLTCFEWFLYLFTVLLRFFFYFGRKSTTRWVKFFLCCALPHAVEGIYDSRMLNAINLHSKEI